ncbi:MAG: transglutaminase domain-containing protein [Chloroflexi bacterium]|nr:MAG: transglutaminase domain-containing protein [Chloroflexota bacterium]
MAEMEWTRAAPRAAERIAPEWLKNLAGRYLDWEDWLTLALLLAAIASVSVPLEGGGWTENMPAITLVSVLAAVTAMFLARSQLAVYLAWPLGILTGALITLWQALIMVGPGTPEERLDAIYWRFNDWFYKALNGGVSNDSLPFHVLIVGLTWMGVFLFSWSVFRWQNAWIGLIPGGIALFLDTTLIGDSLSGAALLYYLFGFLLIMRTSLTSRMSRWRRDGTAYPQLISLTFLNFSSWLLLVMIAAAWIAPVGPFHTPQPVQGFVDRIEAAGVDFVRLAGPLHVKKVVPLHSYTGVLPFQGSVSLTERELLSVKVNDPNLKGPYILRGTVYDKYGSGGWESGKRQGENLSPYTVQRLTEQIQSGSVNGTLVPLDVQVVANSVVGTVIFVPGQAVSADRALTAQMPADSVQRYVVDLPDGGQNITDGQVMAGAPKNLIPLKVVRDSSNRVQYVEAFNGADQALPDVASLEPNDRVDKGQSYQVSSFIPTTTPEELQKAGRNYPTWVSSQYLQLPDDLPQRVKDLAREITSRYLQTHGILPTETDKAGTRQVPEKASAYDLSVAIQEYLRAFPVDYSVPDTPAGRDTVDYFLFDTQRGYFDYHASAMVVMLRSLGVPARLGVGFVVDESDYDHDTEAYVVRDRNSYAWPQIYFPGYGWVDFNPTPDRPADLRPQVSDPTTPHAGLDPDILKQLPVGADPIFDIEKQFGDAGAADTTASDSGNGYATWIIVAMVGLAVIIAGAAALGWQRSVVGLPLAQQHWEKLVRLSSWAGCPLQQGQTPAEFANGLQRRFLGLRGVSVLAAAYNRSRFGRRPPDAAELERIRELWPDIRAALVSAILGRLTRQKQPPQPPV